MRKWHVLCFASSLISGPCRGFLLIHFILSNNENIARKRVGKQFLRGWYAEKLYRAKLRLWQTTIFYCCYTVFWASSVLLKRPLRELGFIKPAYHAYFGGGRKLLFRLCGRHLWFCNRGRLAQIPSTCLKSHVAVTWAEIFAHPKKTSVMKTCLHLKLIVYFPLQARHYHAVCKDVHVCGGTFVRLLPDVDRYDVQHVVLYSCCDWSRAGLLHYNSTYRFTYFKQ